MDTIPECKAGATRGTAPQRKPLAYAVEPSGDVICPRCAEPAMRLVESRVTRDLVLIEFRCCACEQRAALAIEAHRCHSVAAWEVHP